MFELVDQIGIQIWRLRAVLLQAVISGGQKLSVSRIEHDDGVIQIAELHGIDVECDSLTSAGFKREKIFCASALQDAAHCHGKRQRLWVGTGTHGSSQLLFKIRDQNGSAERSFLRAREGVELVAPGRD